MAGLDTFYDETQNIWSGPKERLYFDFDTSIGKILFTSMKNHPNNITQISESEGTTLTNKDALTSAIRIAQSLKKMGFNHEDVIGIAANNSTYVMPLAVGCWLNATPFHAINPILDDKTTEHLFGLTKPKLIFCDGQVYEKIRLATAQLNTKIYTVIDHIEGVPKIDDLLAPTQTELYYAPTALIMGGDQTMAILSSSGTTGMPKAVCMSNHKLVLDNGFLTSEDVTYSSSGLDWYTGICTLVFSCTNGSTRIITNQPYSAEYFVEIVKKYKVTYCALSPRHVATLVACPTATTENLSSMRVVTIGGGVLSLTTFQRLQAIMRTTFIGFGYGFTESGGISAAFGPGNGTSVGKLLPGLRVRIVDEAGKNLGPNEQGEILVHTGHGWNGYYRCPVPTQAIRDPQGWFHSGDLGYFDEKNLLYVVDRKKEILKYQGMQYSPAEIEDVISELPQVVDVCVVGVYDEKNGDAAGVVVVKAKGSSLTEQDVKNHVAEHFTVSYKHLHAGVIFVDALPSNDNGKTNKIEAKALFTTLNTN